MKKISQIALEVDLIIQAALLIVTVLCFVFGLAIGEIAIGALMTGILGEYQALSAIFFAIWMRDINRIYFLLAAVLVVVVFFKFLSFSLLMFCLPMALASYYYWYSWHFNKKRKE
ncbi:MAG: hypothetical protein IPN76_34715 [Saprospiraceae bacterium]|nr:hypothetical protein [Saprospiraceae bacterium]